MRQPLGHLRGLSGGQWRGGAVTALVYLFVWLLVALPVSFAIFLQSSKTTVLASHDAVVSPSLDGYATLDLGPYLPNLRYPTGTRLGAEIDLGKTNLTTYQALIERYAFIGSQPEGQVAKLQDTLVDLAVDSALTGGVIALAGPGLWLLLGRQRRAQLFRHFTVRRSAVTVLAGALVVTAVTQPWNRGDEQFTHEIVWQSIGAALPEVPIPAEAEKIEVEGGLMTSGTKRLARSAFDTYTRSLNFYKDVYEQALDLGPRLHQPAEDETVVLLVSDRHDNVGMDKVARAIADAGGATVLFDAGDDTSTGSNWEAFSLESLAEAFEDFDERYAIAGNHDNGDFVIEQYDDLGFTHLEGEVIDGPDGMRLLGIDDPRSSGLGSWRDAGKVTFAEQSQHLADLACEHQEDGDRINTLLVHDANSGQEALERGCVDLVLGGHIHAQLGPTLVIGDNGERGYTYTNGTTGGAAYALAIGSKLRRDAEVTLVTYRDGRPVGIQPVTVRTVGDFRVGGYIGLDLSTPPVLAPSGGVSIPGIPNSPSAEGSP
ncbi:MAG TPA: metallophosphoesterase [Nocardioidaceae bacterium]|nr:metallophosphoesterase [Nocardioidaceae bacterium]